MTNFITFNAAFRKGASFGLCETVAVVNTKTVREVCPKLKIYRYEYNTLRYYTAIESVLSTDAQEDSDTLILINDSPTVEGVIT